MADLPVLHAFCLLFYVLCIGVNQIDGSLQTHSKLSFSRSIFLESKKDPHFDNFCKDDQYILKESHIVGDCSSFNKDPCLCELNPNCEYSQESEKCRYLPDDCSSHRDNHSKCRASQCYFDCGSRRCVAKTEVPQTCSGGCNEFCFDICSCHIRQCQYTAPGSCQDFKDIDCPASFFRGSLCGRQDSFYLHNGIFCKNVHTHGNCDVEETILAVNFGGDAATDAFGISHLSENEVPPRDEHKIKLSHTIDLSQQGKGSDATFYKTVIYADAAKREPGRCVEYSVPICEDGVYELVVKTMEVFDVMPGEKLFNVKLGDAYVFPEVDVMKLAGQRFKPLQLITNFQVKRGLLTIDGGMEYPVKKGNVPLGFCYSDCASSEGYFVVAAFSVSKFETAASANAVDCKSFNGDPWGCRAASCQYNYQKQQCTSSDNGCSPTVEKIPKCSHLNLDVLFLLDSSSSYPDTAGSTSLVLDEFPRIVEIAASLRKKHPHSKFGIALFSDFSCQDYSSTDCSRDHGGSRHHDQINGCYRRHLPLTENLTLLGVLAQRELLTILFSPNPQPGLFVATLATKDGALNWTHSPFPMMKMIVLVTDDKAQVSNQINGWDIKAPATFDGGDTCWGTLVPSREELNEFLRAQQISLFFLVGKGEQAKSYRDLLDAELVASGAGNIKDDVNVIAAGVERFIQEELTKIADKGGCTQEKPKCLPMELELLFLLDSSSDYHALGNDISLTATSSVYDAFERIVPVTDLLRQKYPRSKFGIALFSEFSCDDLAAYSCIQNATINHNDPDGCYKRHQELTEDLLLFKESAKREKLPILVSPLSEPGLFGAMLAIEDVDINWTPGTSSTLTKVIVMMTNSNCHLQQANPHRNKTVARFDGTDSCRRTLQPTVEEYSRFFQREGIALFLLGDNDGTINSYRNYIRRRLVEFDQGHYEELPEEIGDKLLKFIEKINRKKKQGNLEDSCPPEKPRCPPVKVEMLFLLDSSSDFHALEDDMSLTKKSSVYDAFQRLIPVIQNLRQKFRRSKFGIALFSEFSCDDLTAYNCIKNTTINHNDPDGCYISHQELTGDMALFKQSAKRDKLPILVSPLAEPGLFGVMLAIEDLEMNWTPESSSTVNKIIVMMTNSRCHLQQANPHFKKKVARFDGFDSCRTTLQPTVDEYSRFFNQEGISIFLLGDNDVTIDSYRNYIRQGLVEFEHGYYNGPREEIEDKLVKFVEKINGKKEKESAKHGLC